MMCISHTVSAQTFAVKTNLLYDAFLNVNLGVEAGLTPRWTLDVSGDLNAWTLPNETRYKHYFVQPELRYYLCERFQGHFFGLHLHAGQYNVGGIDNSLTLLGTDFSALSQRRFQGWFAGGGLAYGYAWILGRHWNLEAELGAGYAYTLYDTFRCSGCGKKIATDTPHHYIGLTKAAINIVYVF